MAVLWPFLQPLVVLFGGLAAVLGAPVLLADREKRARRLGFLVVLVAAFLFVHGELRSVPAIRAGLILAAGTLGAAAALLGGRDWLLRRAVVAERPRSPDEWIAEECARLWTGRLRAIQPLAGEPPCLYRRTEIDRWDDGHWRRITTREAMAESFELCGRTRRMSLSVPVGVLRHAAVELEPCRAAPDGWREDPDPDPAALYRARTLGVTDGVSMRVLARAEKREALVRLRQAHALAFAFDERGATRLGARAAALLTAALACAGVGLWAAWP